MFDWLYDLLGVVISFFNTITGSYALALLLYALMFKIIFLFFSVKQQKNQIKMAKLTPKIELIKAKYKGRTDQVSMQKQQQEIMDLQQKEGYSAFSGCLPLLIQLPIIMLLYAVIQSPITYIAEETDVLKDYNANYSSAEYETPEEILAAYGNDIYKKNEDGSLFTDDKGNYVRVAIDPVKAIYKEFVGGDLPEKINEIDLISKIYEKTLTDDEETNKLAISDIERLGIKYNTIPDFRLFGVNLAATPSITNPSILIIIPILAAAASWLSMYLTRKLNKTGMTSPQDEQTQQSMKMMDLVMPVMTLFIAFNFSGMLGIYWIYQSLLGLLQSFLLAKLMPVPKFTEDELREMRRQQKEAEKLARAAAKTVRHRSLHYIDEDDYDELPSAPEADGKKTNTTLGGIDAPEIKD